MKIVPRSLEISPMEESAVPALKLKFKRELQEAGLVFPLSITGSLLAEDEKIIAPLLSIEPGNYHRYWPLGTLGALGSSRDPEIKSSRSVDIELVSFLSQEALNHIEMNRRKNQEKNVILKAKIKILYVKSLLVLCPIYPVVPPKETPEEVDCILGYSGTEKFAFEALTHAWLLSGDRNPYFLQFEEYVETLSCEIPRSKWLDDFCPHLKLGHYFIIEVPKIELAGDILSKAISELNQAKELLSKGRELEALNSIRNAIMNYLTTLEQVGNQKKRYLRREIKEAVLAKVPAGTRNLYEEILESLEVRLRELLNNQISKFIKLDTGERLAALLWADVDYAYFELLNLLRYLSQLMM